MRRPVEPSFARALRAVRKARGISQEQFDQVSSRTYVSALERGIKQPTLAKVTTLADVLDVHPMTLLTLTYCRSLSMAEAAKLLSRVADEIESLSAAES
jgi:transcriptional regulator with XRE-family HTH domain